MQAWLLQYIHVSAVELGVTKILPLKTEFGVALPNAKACERIQRQIVAASKQCGRNRLLELLAPKSLADLLVETQDAEVRRILAHPTGKPITEITSQQSTKPLVLMVGPEGGFSVNETELATKSGCEVISLGPRILRIETAAMVLATAFLYA